VDLEIDVAVLRAEGVVLEHDDAWFGRLAGLTLQQTARDGSGPAGDLGPGRQTGRQSRRVDMNLLLADDATLHRLNRQYRSIDRPTDVLSFSQLEGPDFRAQALASGPALPLGLQLGLQLGDVAVSVERARRQALDYGHPFDRELAYLFVHGLLHLLGYDHEADEERAAMRRVEEATLSAAGLAREASQIQ
jgi:probable rRNA maturation factor